MKKIISSFLALLMLLTVANSITFADNATLTTINITDVKDSIKKLGRASDTDSGIALDWTASGIEFTADCSGDVALKIQASCSSPQSNAHENDKDCYYTVYIDGVRQSNRLRVMNGTFTVKIAENLDYGNHTFKIVKMTEAVNAQTVIQSILLNGELTEKPAESDYIIEAIGDSITSGHSAVAIGIADSQRSRFSDGTRTYAYITAENFGAEARVISQSGQTMTSMYSNYQKERFKDSVGTFDFSSVKKPTVVVIGLGTNDLANKNNANVEYWYNKLSDFVKLIREGYNDNSIPFVFVHDMISNGNLRYYVSQAFEQLRSEQADLQAENPDVVYGGFYMTNGAYNGGHPRQSGHSYTARRLTQLLVNEGIIPISALKSDATVSLDSTGKTESLFNGFDSDITVPDGVTYSKVSPLDPSDSGNSEKFSAKFTADGTQSESTVSLGSIPAADFSNYKTKGISFYINYKDNSDYTGVENPVKTKAYLTIKSSDQSFKQVINAEDGVTAKVTLNWEDLSEGGVYAYQRMIYQQTRPEIKLTFCEGSYEYTIDNLKILYNDYGMSTNSASAYTEITEQLPIIGVTDNFDIPTETVTTTTTNPAMGDNTYVTLYDADKTVNSAEYTYSGTKTAPSITSDSGLPYNTSTSSSKLLKYSGAGNYSNPTIEFTGDSISNAVQDSIGVRIWVAADTASPAGNRSGILFSFYDSVNEKYYCATQWGGSKVGITTEGAWYSVFWSDFSSNGNLLSIGAAGGTVKANEVYKNFTKIKLSSGVNASGSWAGLVNNNIYIDDLQLIYPKDYTPSETATATTVTTATTKSETTDLPGTKTLYTMDPDSRPSSAAMTSRDNYVSYTELSGNYAMQITRSGSRGSWQDQAVGFSLPLSEMKELGTPKSLEFNIWTDSGNVYIGQIFYAKNITNNANSTNSTASVGSITPSTTVKKVILDLTSTEALQALENDYAYICLRNSWSGNNTCTYAYIDDVVYKYEATSVKVTVDGIEQTVSGDSFTLPNSTEKGFIGYFDGETLHDAGEVISLDKDLSFTSITVGEVKMQTGAAMRLNNVTGIRYYTTVDTAKINSLKSAGYTVSMGTLISPENLLNGEELTLNASAQKVDVKYTSNEYYTDDTGFKGIVGSLANIREKNINRKFVGRGYITVSLGDYSKTVYAEYSESSVANNTRTIASLAKSVSEDTAYYNSLSDEFKVIVDRFVSYYDAESEF